MSAAQSKHLNVPASAHPETAQHALSNFGPSTSAPAKEPREFFKLYATYTISEGASLEDLTNDFSCLLAAGVAVFEALFEGLSQAEWAGLYMLRQALAVWAEVQARMPAEEREAGGRHG